METSNRKDSFNSPSCSKKITTQKSSKTLIQVRFNKEHTFFVDRERFHENSLYFQGIQQKCFKDHKSRFTEVNYLASYETLKTVVQFINNGETDFDSDNLFEVYQIADYLQIAELKQACLEKFTFNLNRENVDFQLSKLKEYPFYAEEFSKRALKFKESGRPAFSGLYFLHSDGILAKPVLKYFLKPTSSVSDICVVDHNKNDKSALELQYIDNALVACTAVKLPNVQKSLFSYDLLTGISSNITLEHNNQTITCTSNKNLFLISNFKNKVDESMLALSIFEGNNCDKKIESSKTVNICTSFGFKAIHMYFSIYFKDKLFIFYRDESSNCSLDNVYVLVICAKTLLVLSNQKLLLDKQITKNEFATFTFEKIFYLEKHQKLYIKLYKDSSVVLIFDLRNHEINFESNMFQSSMHGTHYEKVFTAK